MALFRCGACHAVYEDHYPPDDSCLKCKRGLIRIVPDTSNIIHPKEKTMTAITPTIKLFTSNKNTGIQINSLIMAHNGNHYHFHGATNDTINVFQQSIALYVLTTNKGTGTMSLQAFMQPESDPINVIHLHTPQDIKDILGAKWEALSPKAIVMKLINYLM